MVWFVALLGSTLEFERLIEVHGLETWQEQEIAGDDEDRALNACLDGWNPGNSLRSRPACARPCLALPVPDLSAMHYAHEA